MPSYRNFTSGITFYVSPGMRKELDQLSVERRLTVSEILREILGEYFSSKSLTEKE
jgi:hypothetical protein